MSKRMTPWELRGYLTYPNHYGKPKPGTREELNWSRGWLKAQQESRVEIEDDHLFGRNMFAAEYHNETK